MAPHAPRSAAALGRLRSVRSIAALALAVALAACTRDAEPPAPRAVSTGVAEIVEACATSSVSGTVESTPVLTAAGGCADAAPATVYRCARRLDPVIAVGGADARGFLGGRFATPVRSIPSDARYLGDADGRAVSLEPGRDGRLYVLEDGVAARWLALPRSPVEDETHAFVLGDSIALASAEEISGALPGWSTTIDAVVGRPSTAGVPIAQTIDRPSASAVVVELGTNDHDPAVFARSAREILRALGGERLVLWVAPHAPSEVTIEVRRLLDRIVGRTSNAVVADWNAAVPADALASDGVHLLPERTGEFADFLAPYLRAWRMAVAGSGATACVPSPA